MIRSFWLAMSAVVVFVGGVLFLPFFGISALVFAMLSGTVLTCLGFIWPSLALQTYRVWNFVVQGYCEFTTRFIERICFFIVLRIVGLLGSSLNVSGPSSSHSMWIPRPDLPTAAYLNPFAAIGTHDGPKNWMANYCGWAWKTGSQWAVCLVPFILLLFLLKPDYQVPASNNIYTLF
jgi:hypothetical protein